MRIISLMLLAPVFLNFPAYSSEETIKQELQQCVTQSDKLDRLLCFDALAQRYIEPSQEVAVDEMVDDFGRQAMRPAENIETISLVIEQVAEDPYGRLRMIFTNGQVWQQLESRRYRLKSGDTVKIKRAALGSFLLTKTDRNASIRVKRLN